MKTKAIKRNAVQVQYLAKGNVLVDHAYIYQRDDTLCAIAIDLKTRFASIFSEGNDENNAPVITLCSRAPMKFSLTEIVLPEFAGWSVWSASIAKDTLALCLVRNTKTKLNNNKKKQKQQQYESKT